MVVMGPDGEAPAVQPLGQRVVAPGMLAEAVHQHDHRARRARRGQAAQHQRFAAGRGERHALRLGQRGPRVHAAAGASCAARCAAGSAAITSATAAVSFLA